MSNLKLEVGKKYKTRDGRTVVCIKTGLKADKYNSVAVVMELDEYNIWSPYTVTAEGRYMQDSENDEDLISEHREPIKVEVWAIAYTDGTFNWACTEKQARNDANSVAGAKAVKLSGEYLP